MMRMLCVLSVAGLLALAPNATAKPKGAKGDKIEMLFKKLDADGDGTLSKDEFSKITELRHKKNGAAKGTGKGVEALFNKLNTSGTGKLTLDEFRKIKELRKNKKDE